MAGTHSQLHVQLVFAVKAQQSNVENNEICIVQPERLLILVARCFSFGDNIPQAIMRAEGTQSFKLTN